MAATLRTLFEQLDTTKEYIELCGPTPGGYAVLQRDGISLPAQLKISNVTNPVVINPYGKNPKSYTVDFVADVRHIPLSTNSTSLVLASYVPLFSSFYLSVPKPMRSIVRSIQANTAANQGLIGALFNLRKRMLKESARVLIKNGLVVLVGATSQDVQYAKKLGFIVIEEPTDANDYTYIGQAINK